MSVFRIADRPLHLGKGGTALVEPAMTGGMTWYADYAARHAEDGAEGRLVSQCTFHSSWDSWEMHPAGAEVVICLAGTMTLIQEAADGTQTALTLVAGDCAINPPGIWHTADVAGTASALFITAGDGTQHRPR